MKILQQPVKAQRNQIIRVHFDKPVVVRLLSKNMFPKYKNGSRHSSVGGFYEESPAEFTVPYDGIWHAVIEKGSHFNPIDVSGRVEVLPPVVQETSYFTPAEQEEPALEAPIEEVENEDAEEEGNETHHEVEDEFTSNEEESDVSEHADEEDDDEETKED